MIATPLLVALAIALAAPPSAQVVPETETVCRPVRDLHPEVEGGTLGDDGSFVRWTASVGDTLRMLVRTAEAGAYQIAVRTAGDGATLSTRVWDTALTGEAVSLGPGHHPLLLTCDAAGDVLLDCVVVRRVGEMVPTEAAAGDDESNRGAYLGIAIGSPAGGGVTVNRVLPDTAATRAGVESGDVLVSLAGKPTTSRETLLRAIGSHSAGDGIVLELLRGGERISIDVELGLRPPERERRRDRAELVLDVLRVRPDETVADIGCGSGWLSETIAGQLGQGGRVYAVEINEQHVRNLLRRAPTGVVPVLSLPDDLSLPADTLDTVVLHDVASHVERSARPKFYESLHDALKPGGRVVVFGPHGKAREMLAVLGSFGFVPVDRAELAALSEEELDKQLWAGIVFCRE